MSKRVTARQVAELAKVSRSTVSFVLNDVPGARIPQGTRQRVLEAARRLDYHPDATARRMVSGRTRVLGFVLRQSPAQAFSDHFLPQVLGGLSQAANLQGYHILIEPIPPEDNTGRYLKLIHERHVDGILLSGPRSDDEELFKVHAEGAPVVLLGRLPGKDIPFVDVDNTGGAYQAVHHLLEVGYRRIAIITHAPPAYTASEDRLAGYRQALEEGGVAYDAAQVYAGHFTAQSGFEAMQALLDRQPLPEAVFVASDTVALGALQAARQRGLRVPGDLALAGFDDIPQAAFVDPPLTTVHLPAFELGKRAAELLIQLLEGGQVPARQIVLETELVVRASCGSTIESN